MPSQRSSEHPRGRHYRCSGCWRGAQNHPRLLQGRRTAVLFPSLNVSNCQLPACEGPSASFNERAQGYSGEVMFLHRLRKGREEKIGKVRVIVLSAFVATPFCGKEKIYCIHSPRKYITNITRVLFDNLLPPRSLLNVFVDVHPTTTDGYHRFPCTTILHPIIVKINAPFVSTNSK